MAMRAALGAGTMSFAIAAVGTGGHVFPGLAVGEALVAAGVARDDILFVGGDRLEATVYPQAGFPFLQVPLQGLTRSLSLRNLRIPFTLVAAIFTIWRNLRKRGVKVVLGLGGYVTIPAAIAARLAGATVMVSEQNAHAGLANRLMSRLAARPCSPPGKTQPGGWGLLGFSPLAVRFCSRWQLTQVRGV